MSIINHDFTPKRARDSRHAEDARSFFVSMRDGLWLFVAAFALAIPLAALLAFLVGYTFADVIEIIKHLLS